MDVAPSARSRPAVQTVQRHAGTATTQPPRLEYSMELDTLQALYIEGLRDLYSAENQILKALPKMRKAASNPEVQQAFETHLAQTEQQVQRLVRICDDMGVAPTGKHCKGMEGLIEEGNELMKEDGEPDVIDAGLIAAAQHVEH